MGEIGVQKYEHLAISTIKEFCTAENATFEMTNEFKLDCCKSLENARGRASFLL